MTSRSSMTPAERAAADAVVRAASAHPSYSEAIAEANRYPTDIAAWDPFIACMGGVGRHTDHDFPEWSAFFTLHNGGCTVWQRGGYRGVPNIGDRFTLNIHKQHGVLLGKGDGLLVLLYADGNTEKQAIRHLKRECARLLREEAKRKEKRRGK